MKQTRTKHLAFVFLFSSLMAYSPLGVCEDGNPKECLDKTVISGMQFPSPEKGLLDYVAKGNRKAMREHEWQIFAGLIRQGGRPLWEDWDSKCEVKLSTVGCDAEDRQLPPKGIRGLEFPVEMITHYLQDNKLNASGYERLKADLDKGPVLASVRFNPEAACHLLKNHLTSPEVLKVLLGNRASVPSIPSFDPPSIAVKLDWEFLEEQRGPDGTPKKYYLHVFDPVSLMPAAPESGGSYSVLSAPKVEVVPDQECLDRNYSGEPIPLSCFYSSKVTKLSLPTNDLVLHLGHQLLIGPGPHYVVLIGIHLATREIPEWTWATFYWSRRALDSERMENQNRPAAIKAPWNHYSMLTTFNANLPPEPGTGGQPICSSPYLEGGLSHGASSNCLFCHQFASFTGTRMPRDSEAVGSPPYTKGQRPDTTMLERTFLANSLSTTFLWSLADVDVDQEQRLLDEFKLHLQSELKLHRQQSNPVQ